ncbi:ciliary protein causing Leber congenital amaurosis disease-domain-containing protein [Chytriomyces sp. MP71]|nr:ciliary protein causing Leber congenital amaurosis disease-domain-containing protein [Chytriomyces sp. MP71]
MATDITRDALITTPSADRAKIYGGAPTSAPTTQHHVDPTLKGDSFLPRVVGHNGAAFHTSPATEVFMKPGVSQISLVLDQMDRLRAVMREKEIDLLKLRHENMILKQIERRQQKEIEHLDCQSQDAPKLIRGLREEIAGLKSKIKAYYSQLNAEERRVRTLNDQCLKLRDTVTRLEQLTASNFLLEREELTKKVAQANERLALHDSVLSETHRKSEMVEKLLNNENRQLRGKIHNLTAENSFLKDKIQKLTDSCQERDKEIASLSIYRYNAVHKKAETVVCKKCVQRDKDENEFKRKQSILERIPILPVPIVSATDGNTVQVLVAAPCSNPENNVEYDKLTLKVTTDPTFSTITKEFNIAVQKASELVQDADKNNFQAELTVNKLSSGQYYHFLLVASCEGIQGSPSQSASVLVDEIPIPPPKPVVAHSLLPPVIQVFVEPSHLSDRSSPPTAYQIYHSNDAQMTESFLIGELTVQPGKQLSFAYNNPRIGAAHYFKIAAINSKGVSQFSEISDAVVMDCPPNRPYKPHITKLDSRSIHILTTCESNGGTDTESWKIRYSRVAEPEASTTLSIKANGLAHNHLDHVIEGLEPGENYVFAVVAVSPGGDSESSENSDEVNLDMMIPIPDPPDVEMLSATSVVVHLPREELARYGERPKITGYRIFGHLDTSLRAVLSALCPVEETNFVIEGLERGCSYNFGLALCGENSKEGEMSETVFVPLAAAITLPPSPDSSDITSKSASDTLRDDPEAPAPMQLKSKSKSRSLSLTQRSQNMHDGNPAYHDPEAEPFSNSQPPILAVEQVHTDGRVSKRTKSNNNLKHTSTLNGRPPKPKANR